MSDARASPRGTKGRKGQRTKADRWGANNERIEVCVPRELRDRVRFRRRQLRVSQSKLVLKWIVEGLERDEGDK